MAKNLNKIVISGNQGGEARKSEVGGKTVVNFLLINSRYIGKDDKGNKREAKIAVEVTLWGKLAESMYPYLTKDEETGKYRRFTVKGRINEDTPYKKKDGEMGRTERVTATSLSFGGSDLNDVTLVGRMAHDPELVHTESGKTVTNISIFVNEYAGKDSDGEAKFKSTKFRATFWNEQAEAINRVAKKGSLVLLQGALEHTDPVVSGQGQVFANIIIHPDEHLMVLAGESDNTDYEEADPNEDMYADLAGELGGSVRPLDDDIPF